MTKFFPWPSQIAKEQQARHRYEILSLNQDARAYTNKLPAARSKYWSAAYIIWDLQIGERVNKP